MSDKDPEVDIALEEWKTLRAETLQSQNQRFTAFQVSVAVFAALYGAYLTPQSGLRSDPIIFQTVLIVLLIPFVRIVGGLRLRDFMQACYIGNFTQLKVPALRYTQRQNAVPREVRNRTSSADLIQRTYVHLALFTIPVTLGYGYLSSAKPEWYERIGATALLDLVARLALLMAATGFFFKAKRDVALSETRRNEIFDAIRLVVVKELLSGTLVPQGRTLGWQNNPAAWEALFASEPRRNKAVTLKALEGHQCEWPQATAILSYLRAKWKG